MRFAYQNRTVLDKKRTRLSYRYELSCGHSVSSTAALVIGATTVCGKCPLVKIG